jgi:sulfite exporter TauE/SafE
LHLGRLAGYASAGALLAGGVSLLGVLRSAAPVAGALWTMLQVAAFVYGGLLLWTGRQPAFLGGERRPVALAAQPAPLRFVAHRAGPARAGAAGLAWALMPCGLLQSALLVAALASGPVQGGAVMAAFASASSLGLWLAPHLWQRMRSSGGAERWGTLAVRGAGLLLAAASLAALAQRLTRAADGSWCLT